MGKKLVIDTNTLISALGWEGKEHKLFTLIIERKFELIISTQQLVELKRVMDYPKFKFTEEQKQKFLSIIYEIATIITVSEKLKLIKEDPDDDIIIETATEGKANHIITGDPHLLNIKGYQKIPILTTTEFLNQD